MSSNITCLVSFPCVAKSYKPGEENGVPTTKPASECASSITFDSSPTARQFLRLGFHSLRDSIC